MPKTAEEIIEEVRQNVIRDRSRLEKFLGDVLSDIGSSGDLLARADAVAKLSDSLTKSNSQLAEMAKLVRKSEPEDEGDGWSEEDADGMFDQIGPDHTRPRDENN